MKKVVPFVFMGVMAALIGLKVSIIQDMPAPVSVTEVALVR